MRRVIDITVAFVLGALLGYLLVWLVALLIPGTPVDHIRLM